MNIGSIYQKFQSIMRREPIVVLGCGASIASGHVLDIDYPSMPDLANAINQEVAKTHNDIGETGHNEWLICEEMLDQIGLEEALQQSGVADTSLLRLVRRVIARKVGEADKNFGHALFNTSNVELPIAKLLRYLVESVSRSSPAVHVITPNYDHIVEYSCDLNSLPCVTGFVGCRARTFRPDKGWQGVAPWKSTRTRRKANSIVVPSPHVRLYKPHGSLLWVSTPRGPMEIASAADDQERIIAIPGNSKYEECLTVGVLDRQRELANSAIRKAQATLFYGYGFNDRHLETAVRQRLKDGIPAIILSLELTPNAVAITKNYPTVWALSASEGNKTKLWHKNFQIELDDNIWELGKFLSDVIGVSA